MARQLNRQLKEERIGLVGLHPLKSKSRTYYITIDPKTVHSYGLVPGDLLKVALISVRKDREIGDPVIQ